MKKLFKLLFLPLAVTCCSMTTNVTSIRFVSLGITDEDPSKGTLKLSAYINILVKNLDKMAYCYYSWIDQYGTSHSCGESIISALTVRQNVHINGCEEININELYNCSPVTFVCDVRINKEGTYRSTIRYNSKTIDHFDISEATNNQEFTTGFLKESTYPDSSQNYYYEDAFTFLNFEDLRVNELYYDLDISYLRFKYRDGLDNTLKGDFRFAFYDRYNLFPDFPIGESMYRYIPLKLNKDGDECYFTFAPTIYYDPLTHDSSLIQKEGYLPYQHLMLPFKGAAELKFLPCYIDLKVNSHTNFSIMGKFMMTYMKKYFGDCEDSEFCDTMHQDEEVNIREKVVEVTI